MITRNGFVSNSSSSSFIVGFPKEPIKNHEELYALMSPGTDYEKIEKKATLLDSWYCSSDDIRTDYDVVIRVFDDMGSTKEPEEVFDQIAMEYYDGDLWDRFKHIKDYKEREQARIEYSKTLSCNQQKFNNLISQANAKFGEGNYKFYTFSYADDSGEGWLEHSGIFDNLPYIRFSHH